MGKLHPQNQRCIGDGDRGWSGVAYGRGNGDVAVETWGFVSNIKTYGGFTVEPVTLHPV